MYHVKSEFFEVRICDGVSHLRLNSSYIEEGMEYYLKNNVDVLDILRRDYRDNNIDFLKRYPQVKGVILQDANYDISVLYDMPNLRWLCFSGETHIKALDLRPLEHLRYLTFNYAAKPLLPEVFPKMLAMRFRHFRKSNLTSLPEMPQLAHLEMVQCSCESLEGIEHYGKLEDLEMAYCSKLFDISALANMKNMIRVEFDNCKKALDSHGIAVLGKMTTLIRLRILSRSLAIPSLAFLKKLPHLYSFYTNANVLDGDVSCLSNIAYSDFQPNRRHYNLKREELAQKNSRTITPSVYFTPARCFK